MLLGNPLAWLNDRHQQRRRHRDGRTPLAVSCAGPLQEWVRFGHRSKIQQRLRCSFLQPNSCCVSLSLLPPHPLLKNTPYPHPVPLTHYRLEACWRVRPFFSAATLCLSLINREHLDLSAIILTQRQRKPFDLSNLREIERENCESIHSVLIQKPISDSGPARHSTRPATLSFAASSAFSVITATPSP